MEEEFVRENKCPAKVKEVSYGILEDIKSKFYELSREKATACLFIPLLSSAEQKITEISKTTSIGTTLDVGFLKKNKSIRDIFLLKFVRSKRDEQSLIHEAFVGLAELNHLRKFIPNFAYVYSLIKCGEPKEVQGTITKICHGEKQIDYLVYENIAPSTSFLKFVEKGGLKSILNYLFQIVLALRLAHEKCKFTHYDLHLGNILLREFPDETFYIPYEDFYLKSNRIATMIDYDRSFVEHSGSLHGVKGLESVGVLNKSYPLFDLYKIFVSVGFSLIDNKRDKDFAKFEKYLRIIFGKDINILEVMKKNLSDFLTLGKELPTELMKYYPGTESYYNEFIKLFQEEGFSVKIVPEGGKILHCEEGCMSFSSLLR